MKRHQVMDLYHGKQNDPIGDWVSTESQKPNGHCKVQAKMQNGDEFFAYYYSDL